MNLSDRIKGALGEAVLEIDQPRTNRLLVYVPAESVAPAVRAVVESLGARFATITGVESRGGFELLYHLVLDSEGAIVTLKTRVSLAFPEVESVAPMLAGALWIEREVHDILGVSFRGHPDMRRLVLSDDWPEGVPPMRRKYTL